jgi:leucyl aminopeptidase
VDRHQGRLIFLEYTGEGEINTTALFVGKGITFDTGGLDIKGIQNFLFLIRF